jgi:transcriptional regulator GlxA family with amidase domain
MSEQPIAIGAVLYPGFEMLDMFGPLEMFSVLGSDVAVIHMVAEQSGPVHAALGAEGPIGPKVIADYGFDDAPPLDLILVPGGFGTFPQLDNPAMLAFLRSRSEQARTVTSVCTGSALLAKAGVLDGRRATSNKQFFALCAQQSDHVHWVEEARWVEDGKFVTSSGVSAGMDMTLAVIENLLGPDVADTVAKFTEYTRHRNASEDPFVSELNSMAGTSQRHSL